MNKHHYSAELQTAKQTPTTSKILIEVTCGDFPCHLKANRDKLLALLNCLWKCKKSQRLRITANSFMKIDQSDWFHPLRRSRWENSSRSRNQSDCRICWIPPTHELKKGKESFPRALKTEKKSGVLCLSRPRASTSHIPSPNIFPTSPSPSVPESQVLASQFPRPRPTFSHSCFLSIRISILFQMILYQLLSEANVPRNCQHHNKSSR